MAPSIGPFSTAVEMLAALDAREISSVELVELHLRQIEKHDPTLNAIVGADARTGARRRSSRRRGARRR